MKILYIEDDQGLWSLVKHALAQQTGDLVGAHNLASALTLAEEQAFDLAVVDYELPDGKGLEFLTGYATTIPCIMLTGVGNEELAVACMRAGAKDYMVKDVQGKYLELLPHTIERVMREVHLEQENRLQQRQLAQTRNELQLVFDAAPDLMVILGREQKILQMSASASRHYGITPSQYSGYALDSLLPAADCRALGKVTARQSTTVSTTLSDKYSVTAQAQRLDDDTLLIVFRDQTHRINADKAMAQAEAVSTENRRLQEQNNELSQMVALQEDGPIIGTTPAVKELISNIHSVADTDATVLILGETGTGKELIADELHRLSSRAERAFVKLNCAAIPSELVESELFGHKKGAFTGAQKSKDGRFALADKGTLFLDEIGELDINIQSKLLRAIQEGEVMPIGATAPAYVDVRVIAATNRDLENMVDKGLFRADLYYRLNVVPLYSPALHERRGDIPLLATYFFNRLLQRYKSRQRVLTEQHLNYLSNRAWPGNIRELQNVIERYVVMGKMDHAAPNSAGAAPAPGQHSEPLSADPDNALPLKDVEKTHILQVLERCAWIISGDNGAAAALGLNPSTLRFRMQKLGITRRQHQYNNGALDP